MPKVVLHDRWHSEDQGEFNALTEARAELTRLAKVPWDERPNRAPCGSWRTCGRAYELIEYDDAETELRRTLVVEIDASGVRWLADASTETGSEGRHGCKH